MPVPDFQTLMLPVLRAFGKGHRNVAEILPLLQQEFQLSDEDAKELIPSGRMTVLTNRAHWARTYLAKAGLLTSPARNVHEITAQGQALLSKDPTHIDKALLAGFQEYQDWKDATKTSDRGDILTPPVPVTATPEEQMAQAFQEIDLVLRADLLERLFQMDPIRFEQLILDLLKAMGYGAGSLASHQLTKATGDGGIDGIIHEDALGLDAVYIQAKRYAAETKVGRPAMQQFIGSLTGEGATKGVFVTTSDFSKDGRDYLARVQHRVVLINGADLTRLMIRHGVGVRDKQAYVIRRIDEDYFSDTES